MRRELGLAAVILLGTTGCGVVEGLGLGPEEAAQPQLAGVEATLAQDSTLRASFQVWLTGSTLTGDAELVTGSAMAVDYEFASTLNVDDPDATAGTIRVVAGEAYLQSSDHRPPDGGQWSAVARDPAASFDAPRTAEWLALALSRLFDPMFLISGGLPELAETEETLAGVATTRYAGQWQFAIDQPGPDLAHWAQTVVHLSYLDVSLWVDDTDRPQQLTVASSGALLFTVEVSYADHGAELTVEAPAPDLAFISGE